MKVEIRAKDFPITDGIRLQIEQRLGFALDRFTRRIRSVLVWVGDMNDPTGDHEKCCRMAVQLTEGRVVLEERAADLYAAVDHAAHRACTRIAREARQAYRPSSSRFRAA